ncbi:NADPH-dependent F420 reductase [Thalassospira australica]|uniref:NADPH-dependent F420 reductase n=1 Tax=Thalassospira australica TaxID=1528106 RepID=UPI00051A289D|nr:NAD(P)-binding domain-containing protein [Thalassospira australica]
MQIGVIGTGSVGKTLATKFAALGHQVHVANSRGRDAVASVFTGSSAPVIPSTSSDAFACDIVFLATPWTAVRGVLESESPQNGQILVDTTNIFLTYPPHATIDDLKGDSGSEIVARMAPMARVVKAFNTLPFETMFAPVPPDMKRVLFVAGDDEPAISTVTSLITEIGLHPVALGSLASAGRMMELGGALSTLELLAPAN